MALPAQLLQNNIHGIAEFAACLRQALDFMRSPLGIPAHTDLYELELVQGITAHLDNLPATSLCQYALDCLLVALISSGLAHHRRIMGLSPSSGAETRQQALNALKRDARCGGHELLSWDLLYYRYVRVDLDFTDAQIGQLVNLDPRSLRRHRQLGIHRLADWLFRAELWLRVGEPDAGDPFLTRLCDRDPIRQIIHLDALLEPRPPAACFHPHLADWGTG